MVLKWGSYYIRLIINFHVVEYRVVRGVITKNE